MRNKHFLCAFFKKIFCCCYDSEVTDNDVNPQPDSRYFSNSSIVDINNTHPPHQFHSNQDTDKTETSSSQGDSPSQTQRVELLEQHVDTTKKTVQTRSTLSTITSPRSNDSSDTEGVTQNKSALIHGKNLSISSQNLDNPEPNITYTRGLNLIETLKNQLKELIQGCNLLGRDTLK